jgi:hypothetical protein
MLKKLINQSNVFDMYENAIKLDLISIIEICEKFLIKNLKLLKNSEKFNNLSKDLIIKLSYSFIDKFHESSDDSSDESNKNDDNDSEDDESL